MLRASSVDEAEQYRPAITRYIRYLIRDSAEAEDLAQETFLRAHQQRETGEGTFNGRRKGVPVNHVIRFTNVWTKRGDWQLVNYLATPIEPQ